MRTNCLFHFQSVAHKFPPWANPDDTTTHAGPFGKNNESDEPALQRNRLWHPALILFLHSSSHIFDLLSWADFCITFTPATFVLLPLTVRQLPLTLWGGGRGQRYGLNYQTHSAEGNFVRQSHREECSRIKRIWMWQAKQSFAAGSVFTLTTGSSSKGPISVNYETRRALLSKYCARCFKWLPLICVVILGESTGGAPETVHSGHSRRKHL